jgi:ankyrin repeat protein
MVVRSATIAKLLLKNISIENINIQDNDGRCALLHAMTGGNFEVVEVLLENGGDPDLESYDESSTRSVLQAVQVYVYHVQCKILRVLQGPVFQSAKLLYTEQNRIGNLHVTPACVQAGFRMHYTMHC